jgi:hypothetical protein
VEPDSKGNHKIKGGRMPRRTRARVIVTAAAVAATFAPLMRADNPNDRPNVRYDPILLTGQPAPGFDGQLYSAFPYHSYVGDANHVVFLGSVNAPYPHAQPNGIFINRDGQTALVAKAGQVATGLADGVHIQSFDINFHRANRAGQVVFESTLNGPGIASTGDDDTNAFANWFWSNGQLTPIAQYRQPAAGVPGAIYRTFSRTTLNDLGHIAYSGDLVVGVGGVTESNNSAFWYGAPTAPQLLAREGDSLPGRPDYRYAELAGFDFPVLAPKGAVAFNAQVSGPGTDWLHNTAVLAGTPGNLSVVAMAGDPAPFTNSIIRDTETHTFVDVNNNAEATFAAILDDGSRVLYAGSAGHLRKLARTTEPAPGLAPANAFDFFYGADINDRGEVAFVADTDPTGEYHHAVYLAHDDDRLELIAAKGQIAPGTGGYTNFDGWFSDPVINKDGQVAFFAGLTGPGVRGGEFQDYGIFATGHAGDLRLIARFGDTFELAPGDVRTIEALSDWGRYGSHVINFNEDSNLSFLMRFTDGSEALVTATVLPEPTALLALAGVPFLVGRRRRRRHRSA